MIRDEVKQVSAELVKLGSIFIDETSNKEQAAEILTAVFGVVKEGLDFASIPKEERAKAIAHAFIGAGSDIADMAMKYSDETTPA